MSTALVTGANRGLGLGLARAFVERGWEVIALVRNRSPELDGLGGPGLEVVQIDLCDDAALGSLATHLGDRPLDVLVNNAGRMGRKGQQGLGSFDRGLWHAVFDINLLTPMRLSEVLLPHLERAERGRIVSLSSSLGSIGGNDSGGLYAYRASKAGLNAMTRSLAVDLEPRGVVAVALSPGWVRTDMGGAGADLDVETSVDGMLRVIENLEPGDSGKFLNWDGSEIPW